MNFLDRNLIDKYRILKEKIPSIKTKNKDFMNKLHNLDMPSDFWWAISGDFAITAEYAILLSIEEPRLLFYLKNTGNFKSDTIPDIILNLSITTLIAKDCILNEDFTLATKVPKKNIDELLVSELEENLITGNIITEEKLCLPFIYLTNFLSKLRLEKIKFLYLKIKKKIKTRFYYKNSSEEKIIFDNDFEFVLYNFLPDNMKIYFPKWFVNLSNYLVKYKHKWKSYFGLERDIYQKILNAKSYEKFKDANITLINHGNQVSVDSWWLWRLSLFPNMKINFNNRFVLPKASKQNSLEDILFCPLQFPYISEFFDIKHFREFMKVYKSAVRLMNNGLKKGKKIKVRYKNFEYLSGYNAPLIKEECEIPIEKEIFEKVYSKYKLIVSMPFSTISLKCYQNCINCLSYNYPFYLADKKTYLMANTFPGVFCDAQKFLNELEKKIDEF
jgi:hypothetical protein